MSQQTQSHQYVYSQTRPTWQGHVLFSAEIWLEEVSHRYEAQANLCRVLGLILIQKDICEIPL